MSANTSFATTTSTLTQFIAKQKITNSVITNDLSSTEYPIIANAPLKIERDDGLKLSTMYINLATSSQNGYISSSDWNTFNGKLSSIVAGSNIVTSGGTIPTISFSVSSAIDMSNNLIKNIASEDYKTNIDIRQAGNQRIYTTTGANSDMYITPQGKLNIVPTSGNVNIQRDISLNAKTLDMVSGVITGISNENYPVNIDIRQAGNQRIYTTGVNMFLDPQGYLSIGGDLLLNGNQLNLVNGNINNLNTQTFQTDIGIYQGASNRIYTTGTTNMTLDAPGYLNIITDVSLNGNTLDMSGGAITRVGSQSFPTNIDIRQGTTQRIYTSGANADMYINPQGNLRILKDVSLNGTTLDMSGGAITRVGSQSFPTNIDIRQGITPRIYTTGANANMTIDPSGNLRILSDVSLNGNTLDMSGGLLKNATFTDLSLNGNTLDMVGGAITRVGSESFSTNIDIRQGITPRIYTTGTNMTIDPAGYLSILSDVSLNGNTLDMSGGLIKKAAFTDLSLNGNTLDMVGGAITRVGSQSFSTNIDIREGTTQRIYTTGTNMTIDPAGNLRILSDVSLNGNTLDISGGKCIDVSGIYGLANKNLRIDASSVTFTNNLNTHMVIDNCGITLNDISYSNTGTVLSYNTTNKRVHYMPLYDTSSYTFSFKGGSGPTYHSYTMTLNKIVNTITIHIPDVSCAITTAADSTIDFSFNVPSAMNAEFITNSNINFPAIVYETTTTAAPTSTLYYSGMITIGSDGTIKLYKSFDKTNTWASNNTAGMLSQCFTYTV